MALTDIQEIIRSLGELKSAMSAALATLQAKVDGISRRLDAYEALEDAYARFGGRDGPLYLTGHSMGGHGVWHLAAHDPDRWSAIAPSAAWCSFDTYGGAARPSGPLESLWRSCDGGSRTEDFVANLAPIPTFVLHGTKDPSVPLSEAEAMIARLEKAGGKPARHDCPRLVPGGSSARGGAPGNERSGRAGKQDAR